MAKEHFQRDMRRAFNADDQFGRSWLVTIEKETGDPVNVVPTFTDPLRTPFGYIQPRMNASMLEIRFDLWLAQLRESLADWLNQFHEIGMGLYGDAYDAEAALKNPRSAHRQRAGDKPLDPAVVERARDGDKELLGLAPMSPKTLAMLPRSYRAGYERAKVVA